MRRATATVGSWTSVCRSFASIDSTERRADQGCSAVEKMMRDGGKNEPQPWVKSSLVLHESGVSPTRIECTRHWEHLVPQCEGSPAGMKDLVAT